MRRSARVWDAAYKSAIAEFRKAATPNRPFEIRPGHLVADPAKFRASLEDDLLQGPEGARARIGSLLRDLEEFARAAKETR